MPALTGRSATEIICFVLVSYKFGVCRLQRPLSTWPRRSSFERSVIPRVRILELLRDGSIGRSAAGGLGSIWRRVAASRCVRRIGLSSHAEKARASTTSLPTRMSSPCSTWVGHGSPGHSASSRGCLRNSRRSERSRCRRPCRDRGRRVVCSAPRVDSLAGSASGRLGRAAFGVAGPGLSSLVTRGDVRSRVSDAAGRDRWADRRVPRHVAVVACPALAGRRRMCPHRCGPGHGCPRRGFPFALVGVVCARDALSFLFFWELMTLVPAAIILVGSSTEAARHASYLRRDHASRRRGDLDRPAPAAHEGAIGNPTALSEGSASRR